MDAQVDEDLGDSISYRVRANQPPLERVAGSPTIPGFLILRNPELDLGRPSTWTCKVHRKWLPDEGPVRENRISHAKLPGVMRPATDTIDDDGDYYLFNLQMAG